jgi:histidyl-tRNA synthetase
MPKPFKRYAIGPVWRYERPSETHRREFWQMDVDIVGVADPIADAETLAVAVDCLRRIGFESFIIRLNDRRILEALVEAAGLPSERRLDIFRAIDKREKIGDEGVLEELEKLDANPEASRRLLELAAKKGDPSEIIGGAREALKDSPAGLAACDFILSVVEYSAKYGIEPCIVVDLGLARGLDYYTGPVFEIFAKGYESYGSIAAGGRYDELVQLFGGKSTPMTGISMGVDRLVPLLEKKGVFNNIDLTRKIYVVSTSEKVRPKAIEVTQMLRRAGVSADFDLLGRGMSRQLEIANRKGVKRVIIVGKKELRDGCVLIRDMATAEQKKVEIVHLLEEI